MKNHACGYWDKEFRDIILSVLRFLVVSQIIPYIFCSVDMQT